MKCLETLLSRRRRSVEQGKNAELILAMREAVLNDPENLNKMYKALLASTVLVPTPEIPSASNPGEMGGDVELQLVTINDQQGRKLTPLFTDIEALRNFDPNTPWLSVQARKYFETISHYCRDIEGAFINPFDPIRQMIRPAGVITRADFELLARGLLPTPAVRGGLSTYQLPAAGLAGSIQPPKETLPSAVEEVLRRSAESLPEITTLHFFVLVHSHGSPS